MKLLLRNKYFLIPALLITLLIVVVSFPSELGGSKPPQIISTTPSNRSQNFNLFSSVMISFNKEVKSEDFSAISTPQEEWVIKQILPNKLEFVSRKPLSPSTNYQLTLYYQGEVIDTLSLTTMPSQSDPKLLDEIQDEVERDYPLAKLTPLDSPNYRVVYSSPLTLEIRLKNNSLTEDQAISQVKSWVEASGGKADLHKYVVEPYKL